MGLLLEFVHLVDHPRQLVLVEHLVDHPRQLVLVEHLVDHPRQLVLVEHLVDHPRQLVLVEHLVDHPRQLVLVEHGEYVRRTLGAENKLELVDTLVTIHVEGAEDRGGEVTRVYIDSRSIVSSHLENGLQRNGTTRVALSHCQIFIFEDSFSNRLHRKKIGTTNEFFKVLLE